MVVQADGVMHIQGEMNSERQIDERGRGPRLEQGRQVRRDPVNTLTIIESDTKHN